MRATVRRLLAWGVVASLLLPVSLSVVIGLAALLASLGDKAAAIACGRTALALGVVWLVALAATATAGGIVALELAETGESRSGAGRSADSRFGDGGTAAPPRRDHREGDGGLAE